MVEFGPFVPPEDDALPPHEVRILEAHVEPWPDGRRVRVHITLTPFQQRPDLSVRIYDAGDDINCQAEIIENMETRIVFTLHLRGADPRGPFRLEVILGYEDSGIVDCRSLMFSIDETPA